MKPSNRRHFAAALLALAVLGCGKDKKKDEETDALAQEDVSPPPEDGGWACRLSFRYGPARTEPTLAFSQKNNVVRAAPPPFQAMIATYANERTIARDAVYDRCIELDHDLANVCSQYETLAKTSCTHASLISPIRLAAGDAPASVHQIQCDLGYPSWYNGAVHYEAGSAIHREADLVSPTADEIRAAHDQLVRQVLEECEALPDHLRNGCINSAMNGGLACRALIATSAL